MKTQFYLIVTRGGSVRTTKNVPALAQNEVAIKQTLNLSDKFFRRFIPEANLTVPDEFVLNPEMTIELVMPDGSDYAEAVLGGKKGGS